MPKENKIPIHLEIDFMTTESRAMRLLGLIGELAVEPVQAELSLPDQKPLTFELNLPTEKPIDPTIVPVSYMHWYYKNQFADNNTSSLPSYVARKLARNLKTEELITDGNGHIVGFQRMALEGVRKAIEARDTSKLSGQKTLRYFFGLMDSLPPLDEPET